MVLNQNYENAGNVLAEELQAIKPGPKPKKDDGTPDRRRRVTPETQPKHPALKPHKHRPNE